MTIMKLKDMQAYEVTEYGTNELARMDNVKTTVIPTGQALTNPERKVGHVTSPGDECGCCTVTPWKLIKYNTRFVTFLYKP